MLKVNKTINSFQFSVFFYYIYFILSLCKVSFSPIGRSRVVGENYRQFSLTVLFRNEASSLGLEFVRTSHGSLILCFTSISRSDPEK